MANQNKLFTWANMGTWIGVWTWIGLGTWINFNTWLTGSNNKIIGASSNKGASSNTYNERYPGFDYENYNKLEKKAKDLWLSGDDMLKAMDEIYQQVLPMVQNNKKMNERWKILNQQAYEIQNMTDNSQRAQANANYKASLIAQQVKAKYNIPANAPDNEVFNDWVQSIPNWQKLFEDYINYNDPKLLIEWELNVKEYNKALKWVYEAGKNSWGIRGMINKASEWWDTAWDKISDATNVLNPIWLATEKIDEWANKLADKITFTGTKEVKSLQDKINNLSDKELQEYRKIYDQMVKNKDFRTQIVHWDNIVEKLWDWITDWWNGTQEYGGDDEQFKKRVVKQEADLWESLTGADDTINWVNDPNVIKFFANIPSSWLRTLTATIRGKTNPVDSLEWLVKLIGTEEWRQALIDKYWSWDAIANAMNYDPVGTADDILQIAEMGKNIAWATIKTVGMESWNTNLKNVWTNILKSDIWWSAIDWVADYWIKGLYWWLDSIKWKSNILDLGVKYLEDTSSLNKTIEDIKDPTEIKNAVKWTAEDIKNTTKKTVNTIKEAPSKIKEWIKEIPDKAVETARNINDKVWDVRDWVAEYLAEKVSGTDWNQNKLFQAQDPSINKLSKNRDMKTLQAKSDLANELIIKDIQKNWWELPTDTASRKDALQRTMKNKWSEITDRLWAEWDIMIDTTKLADSLDEMIKKEKKLWIVKNRADIALLEEQSASLRDMKQATLWDLEDMKQRYNWQVNNWWESSVWEIYKNWAKLLTSEIWKIEDAQLSKLPWDFQKLKNEMWALLEVSDDVYKANIRSERAKNKMGVWWFSRLQWVWDITKWIFSADLWEIAKWTTKVIWWDVSAKLWDRDWLIENWFKWLAEEMKNPEYKSAYSRAYKTKK